MLYLLHGLSGDCYDWIRYTSIERYAKSYGIAGVDVRAAFVMASSNPARAVGMFGELGSIAVGKRADLVIMNDDLEVETVIIGGEINRG